MPYRSEEVEENNADGLASLLIGVTFVVFFAATALGLVMHAVVVRVMTQQSQQQPKVNNNNLESGSSDGGGASQGGKNGGMRSPRDEDGTPPELRSGCGQPTFVQPLDQDNRTIGGIAGGKINHSGKAVKIRIAIS